MSPRARAVLAAYLRVPLVRAGAWALVLTLAALAVLWPLRLVPAERAHGLQRERVAGLTRVLAELEERLGAVSAAAGTRVIHGANSFGEPRAGVVPVLQDLTVEGSYAEVRDVLARVSRMETLTLLDAVEMSANPDGTLVRARLRLVTLSEGLG